MTKFREEMVFQAFQYAREGNADTRIAELLGTDWSTFSKWKRKHPILATALKEARTTKEGESGVPTFIDYVYQRLPNKLKKLWRDIRKAEKSPDVYERVDAILFGEDENTLKHLFVHALVSSNFNASLALRRLNISRRKLENWLKDSPDFAKLIDEIQWHKGNFFESALVDAVKRGDVSAIIFANKTFNRERGYSEKLEVKIDKTVSHTHKVDLSKVPIELRKQLLKALQDKKAVEKVENREVIREVSPGQQLLGAKNGD